MRKKEAFKQYCIEQMNKFEGFTFLQKLAFDKEEFWEKDGKNIFVQGHTSSGKTLIGFSQIWNICNEGIVPKVLYLVPYKALAHQKHEELKKFFPELENEIVLSTSEFKEWDRDIINGTAKIVITIYEKIFLFSNIDPYFFKKWKLIILDEFGIIDNIERGIKADFIFRRVQEQNCRMVVMTTPFYDWSSYIKYGEFLEICSMERPVEIEEYLISQKSHQGQQWNWMVEKIDAVKNENGVLINQYYEVQNDEMLVPIVVENVGYIEMFCQICYEHYLQGHSIIVFFNDREGVRQRVKDLYAFFLKKGVFTEPDDIMTEQFFDDFLGDSEVVPGDLYGIFEEDDNGENILKKALYRGITFHSAAQSYHIRHAIEDAFYGERSFIRIVVATETLAYGVNSNADVVIIEDIQKPNGEKREMLTQNEYKNYIGRAGRYSHKNKGYAYTLIRVKDLLEWKKLLDAQSYIVKSNIYYLDWSALSLYILSMFTEEQSLAEEEILAYLLSFPVEQEEIQGRKELYQERVHTSLLALKEQKLIKHDVFSTRYVICDLGKAVRGYICDISKLENLRMAISGRKIYLFDYAYAIARCLSEGEVYAYVPNSKKYATIIESLHIVVEHHFENWIHRDVISREMVDFVKNIFQIGYMEGKKKWCLNIENKEASRQFPIIRIATMLTLYLEGYGGREIYEIVRMAIGVNIKTMSKAAYYAEISSILAAYIDNESKGDELKSISSALYYGGLPYKLLYMFGEESFSADDRENLIFMNHYLRIKKKKEKTVFDNIKLESMENRFCKLSKKYKDILKCLEDKDD